MSTASPFTPQQMQELAVARKAMKGIRRAVFMAQMDGWSLAVFGALTLVCGLSSATAILVGLGLGAVAFVELKTIPKLKQLDPAAPKTLGYNQLALAAILILYAIWNLISPVKLSDELSAASPQIRSIMGDPQSLLNLVNNLVYFALIAIAIFAQGSMALFYFRRTKIVTDYLAQTPPWIIQMQQAGFSP
jgi:hypothetical protein